MDVAPQQGERGKKFLNYLAAANAQANPELLRIACWFIDTDYNEESFFVRHAYFLGASDPYKALETTLKAEIDKTAWETLHSAVSRPFPKPSTGRIAVKSSITSATR